MSKLFAALPWLGGLFISGVFLDSLRFKFTGHPTTRHIFETLKAWSGIDLFFPAGPWIIGFGELAAASLLLFLPLVFVGVGARRWIGPSQFLGALLAAGIMTGAIAFHLFTPLGTATPTLWENGQPTEWSPALFYTACASWVTALIIALLRLPSVKALRPSIAE